MFAVTTTKTSSSVAHWRLYVCVAVWRYFPCPYVLFFFRGAHSFVTIVDFLPLIVPRWCSCSVGYFLWALHVLTRWCTLYIKGLSSKKSDVVPVFNSYDIFSFEMRLYLNYILKPIVKWVNYIPKPELIYFKLITCYNVNT